MSNLKALVDELRTLVPDPDGKLAAIDTSESHIAIDPSGDTSGVTDTALIVSALAENAITNRPIKLSAGSFYVNQPIDLARDYIEFSGSGKGRTYVYAAAAISAVVLIDNVSQAHVSDMTIDGNGLAAHELSMVHSEGTTRHSIERVRCNNNLGTRVNSVAGDGTINSGAAAFSSASASFTAGDVGKWILITGAGASAINLLAQITAVTDGQHVTLDRNAGTSVTTATYQYFGFAIHNSGCEDVLYLKCEIQGSEASPTSLKPGALLSCPSGLCTLIACDFFAPVFYDCLTLEAAGCNIGAFVSANQAASQGKQLVASGCWIYDGGAFTDYSPIDVACTYLVAVNLVSCHLVGANVAQWCNGRLPVGNALRLVECEYVQSAGNTNTTMTLFLTSTGTTSTALIVDGGKLSIGGSMTTLRVNSGGSSTHSVELRGKVDGVGTYTNFGTNFNTPGVPGSGNAVVNSSKSAMMVYVTGGTVTQIAVDGVNTGLISGSFLVRPMGTITVTYSVAPTWVWQAF